jgi:hypothetical protein
VTSIWETEAASCYWPIVHDRKTARRSNPEDSHLHRRRRENLKSYFLKCLFRSALKGRAFQSIIWPYACVCELCFMNSMDEDEKEDVYWWLGMNMLLWGTELYITDRCRCLWEGELRVPRPKTHVRIIDFVYWLCWNAGSRESTVL